MMSGTISKMRIYTDGACAGNPGPGGYSAIFCFPNDVKKRGGFEMQTTNNRMELKGAICALNNINVWKDTLFKKHHTIEIITDSAYVENAINKGWLKTWEHKQWRTTSDKPVKNRDLWEELLYELKEAKKHTKIRFVKVKGHSNNTFNDLADEHACEQKEKAKEQLKCLEG